jgi:glycosyltransferase involved in cell wall biosynthesis
VAKVLMICHEYPPVGGGAATVATGLARALAREHDVTVITSWYSGLPAVERHGRLTVRRVGPLRREVYGASPIEMVTFSLVALAAAARACRAERFDGCIAIQGIPAAWVALPLAWIFRVPYVVGLVGADVPGFLPERFDRLHRAIGWLTRRTWRRAAAVVANSASLRRLAEQTARPLGIRVHTVLYGADTDVHRPPATPRPEDRVRFLFVGRLSTQKGISYLVEAIALAHDALRGRAAIVVVGEDYSPLQERMRAHALDDVVTFRGWLSREDLAECYAEASVFILPSLDEGRSQAALEAMACGLAMIATDIEGNAGMVEEGVNGFVVPPRDAAALAKALVAMIDRGPRQLALMREASRARVARFSWNAAAERYVHYLEEVGR